MGDFSSFLKSLEKSKANIAFFRKVVLHSHSPESYDNKYKPDEKSNIDILLDKIKSLDLDMIAFTDHMKCSLSCELSSKCKSLPCILPGMEVNFRPKPPWNAFRLHILAIFPENYSMDKVCKFVPNNVPDEKSRTGKEEISDIDIDKFISEIQLCNGICIAAHIDSDRGVRKVFRQLGRDGIILYDPQNDISGQEESSISESFKDWIFSAGFDAIEVRKPSDKLHYRWIKKEDGKEWSIPVLLTNDSHCIEDFERVERIIYVKMTNISYSGLKQALSFPDTRIRFSTDLPKTTSPRIDGIEIVSGDKKGYFKDLKIAFSENLSCLIGPRGSGKSTIVEALRYIFGYNKTLNTIEQPGTDLSTKIKSLQAATLSNCLIRVLYTGESEDRHILEATFDPKQDYGTRVFTLDGIDKEIHDVEATGLFPLRLFGWSEIETLGRVPERQRKLIDRLIPQIGDHLNKKVELRKQLKDCRSNAKEVLKKLDDIISRNRGEILRYREYKKDFDSLNTEDVKLIFKKTDKLKLKREILEQLIIQIDLNVTNLNESKSINLTKGLSDILVEAPKEIIDWYELAKTELNIIQNQSDVIGKIVDGISLLDDLKRRIEIELKKIVESISNNDQEIRKKISDEAGKQVTADLRMTAEKRLKRVNDLRREYNREWELFKEVIINWHKVLYSINQKHDEISGKRARRIDQIENRLNRFGSHEMKISIKFDASKDRDKFTSELKTSGLLNRDMHGQYKANRWPEKISTSCTPVELASLVIYNNFKNELIAEKQPEADIIGLDQSIKNRLVHTLNPIGYDENAEVPTCDRNKLLKILETSEIEWDDSEAILLNNRRVENLSPGQRSSAMLPLIALAENTPLVIDQPEDNLDNRLVGQMLVDILADLKEKRQIIVATHNPNIVVSGDAEQVIVLEAVSDIEGECRHSGSIDDQIVIKAVIDILEGGRDAFIARNKRYSNEL